MSGFHTISYSSHPYPYLGIHEALQHLSLFPPPRGSKLDPRAPARCALVRSSSCTHRRADILLSAHPQLAQLATLRTYPL